MSGVAVGRVLHGQFLDLLVGVGQLAVASLELGAEPSVFFSHRLVLQLQRESFSAKQVRLLLDHALFLASAGVLLEQPRRQQTVSGFGVDFEVG